MKRLISAALAAAIVAVAVPVQAQSGWSAVERLKPGTEILLSTAQTPQAPRQFIEANDTSLVVVNIGGAAMPPYVTKMLRAMATDHPEYLTAAHAGTVLVLDRGVQITPDGLFHNADKLADRAAIIETIERASVVAVSTSDRTRNRVDCAIAGYGGWFLGGFAGGMAGFGLAWAVGATSDAAGMGAMLGGMLVGGSGGASWAYRKCRNKPGHVVYATSPL